MTTTRLRPVVLLVVVALGLRLGYVLLYPQLPLQADALDYDRLARLIAAGSGFRDARGEPETLRAPLYPLFVAALYRVGDPEPHACALAQAVLGALLPLLVLSLGRACFVARVAWLAAVLVGRLSRVRRLHGARADRDVRVPAGDERRTLAPSAPRDRLDLAGLPCWVSLLA